MFWQCCVTDVFGISGKRLENAGGLSKERLIRVIQGDETLWSGTVDPDDEVNWD